jgi:3-oxoacyl-[acyl-carrier-protein] synthase-3
MSRIVSTGAYIPRKVVDNNHFFSTPEDSDAAPVVKFMGGMRERRHAGADETGVFMAGEAAKRALEASEYCEEDIDLIIGCIVPNLYLYPEDLFLVAGELKCKNATVLPMNTSCTSFLSALYHADTLVNAGNNKVVLVISSTVWALHAFDKTKDYSFAGDGAGAVIIDNQSNDLIGTKQICDFRVFHTMSVKSMGVTGKKEYFEFAEDENVDMVEEQVMKPVSVAMELLEENPNDMPDWFIAHQAGLPMLEVWRRQLKLKREILLHTFDKYANMTSSNIPVTLDHYVRRGDVKRGDTLLLFAPAAGAHYISLLWRY